MGGIWERRRSVIFKNKRMVKIKDKDKDKGKAKQCKTIIIEEDPPPAPRATRKTTCRCDGAFVSRRIVLHCSRFGFSLLGLNKQRCSVGSAHSICVSSPVLNGSCKAASPRCDTNRGQREKQ